MTASFTDSPEQAAVIGSPIDDDVLVVAGAGSGKTYTMTRRIITLIGNGVAPERILGLTFTRKAAGELLSRVSAAVLAAEDGRNPSDRAFLKPTISTYDAFFQTIVRQYGLLVGFDQNTQPLSEAGALQIVGDVIGRNMDRLRGTDLGSFGTLAQRVLALSNAMGSAMIGNGIATMRQAISSVRTWDDAFITQVGQAIGDETVPEDKPKPRAPRRLKKDTDATWSAKIQDYHRQLHDVCLYNCANLLATARRRDLLLDLVEEYDAEKRRRNMAQFSDFTIAAYQLATRFPSIGERYRGRFSHVLLDEYQDTSTTQATLLAALFQEEGTAVSAVGDPFQSIYAWRGASPGAFRMFQQVFHLPPERKPYALSVTRRNAKVILEAANDLTLPLRTEPRRRGSSLMREVEVKPLGTMPDAPTGTLGALGYETLGQEIDGVVRFCAAATRGKTRKTAAVLFRSKGTMSLYQQALEQAGMSTLVIGYSAMLERPEIRDVLALLHVVSDHTDTGPLMRLLATPRFGLGSEPLAALADIADDANTEQRHRALVAAGLAAEDEPRSQWAQTVREHRNEVANTVFLPDVLMRGDLESVLARDGRFDARDRLALLRAGRMLRRVDDLSGRPLEDVVRGAAEALDLDIDVIVAQAMHSGIGGVNPALARIPIGAVTDLVDVYVSETAPDSLPTLRGFMAWVDSLRSIEDETASLDAERRVDVELMTVHQSKGLEWDAVAVVGLEDGVFPSRQGDHLNVKTDDAHPGGTHDGEWHAPEYHERARTWLDDPTAVPAPIRADAGILPRFPHDAPQGGDPIADLAALDDVELIDDEIYGSLRAVGDGVEDVDPDSWHLTQEEEYGRRLHADERRLMYVALTRARTDVLLTYARTSSIGREPKETKGRPASPSNFWLEVHDAMIARPDAVTTARTQDTMRASDDSLASLGVERPQGMFVGERALETMSCVVDDAWNEPLERGEENGPLPWPVSLSPGTIRRLGRGAAAVVNALHAPDAEDARRRDAMDVRKEPVGTRSVGTLSSGTQSSGTRSSGTWTAGTRREGDGPLVERARMLVADDDLMSGTLTGDMLDEAVEGKARRILAGSRQSVTGLQAMAGTMGERERRRYWRGIVRPIPSVAAPSASAGTRFHAWAERFIDAGVPGSDVLTVSAATFDGGMAGTDPAGMPTIADDRRAMLAQLADAGSGEHTDGRPEDHDLSVWKRRLAESTWARRTPVWAERQIVVALPQLDGIIVNGKLDAVFRGGLDPEDDTKRFTVVDWKTGRRPRTAKDRAERLVQLDLYRLLLAEVEGVPLDTIDAALYYVSEPDERHRVLRAERKTEQEIIAELSSGVPEQSDDD